VGEFQRVVASPTPLLPHAKETFRVRLQQIQVQLPSTHRQIDACFFELGFEVLGGGTEGGSGSGDKPTPLGKLPCSQFINQRESVIG
jgi:hypothetical protein